LNTVVAKMVDRKLLSSAAQYANCSLDIGRGDGKNVSRTQKMNKWGKDQGVKNERKATASTDKYIAKGIK
jgi:hypothetical protein